MDSVASYGLSKVSHAPRGTILDRHVILPRRLGLLVFNNHPLSAFKIMARKPHPKLSFVHLEPYEDDDVTIHIEDDVKKDNPKKEKNSSSKSSNSRLSRPLMKNWTHNAREDLEAATSAGDFQMRLRKPGVVYQDDHRISIPRKKPEPNLFMKWRSEGAKNVTLLKKPEVGKPYRVESRPGYLEDEVPSDGSMISRSYKAQKSEYELYISRPLRVSLNPKPEVMTRKPNTEILGPTIDKSLEERENRPYTMFHTNLEKRQKIPPPMSKFTAQAGIDLRKPSIPTDDTKSNPKPETNPIPLLDMQINSKQDDTKSELELKPSLDMVRFGREDWRNVVTEEVEPSPLLDEHTDDRDDLSNIAPQERGETASDDSSEFDLKPKPELNTVLMTRYSREDLSNVLLHKKFKVDVGLQQTNQGTDGNKMIRNEPSDAGSNSSEEEDWKDVENLLNNGERILVELTGYNNEGFFATLGSIVGSIPYQNLNPRYKFFDFEPWLRKKGVDLTFYQPKVQMIDTIGSMDSLPDLGIDTKTLEQNEKISEQLPNSNSALNFEDLLLQYQGEKNAFLSSFIGQKLKVRVLMADRNSKEVVLTGKHRVSEALVNKKRKLMARLKVGDIVKCCIYKFTYAGTFVKVEGVSALIPHAEVTFDGTLDLLSSLKLGQILDARVHQLDYKREHINLSLKGVIPDPQINNFESIVGNDTSFSGTLQEAQLEEEWEDVESLIKELEKLEEVNTVSKGTFFLSSGLAPAFQVYMAPMVDGRYRLLARFGNKVQEVLVQASMDEEKMKSSISACTSRIA
ncbi:30S ribosomal protein S1 [Rhynchospora pubera]|uniref:30S ribosomal protein S1 n=1 Tax=Rhynchospora pubera TaxID=906938 RepID=A0AAV8GXD0_9POAL|nr:30S ribosomal protein S1 [Rhynchospora pubera]